MDAYYKGERPENTSLARSLIVVLTLIDASIGQDRHAVSTMPAGDTATKIVTSTGSLKIAKHCAQKSYKSLGSTH